ncbi:MAG: DUF4097 family beta strand repeat protein [Clostridia bacterium]|nr:DUF4097 family beta strand repeat protein [Clostridia bacterium]
MKKYIITILVFMLLLALASCVNENVVLDDFKTYEITSDIHSLDIQINAADFKIEYGDEFLVESNLKYLSVSETDGVLTIIDEAKSNSNYSNAVLTLYVPNSIIFDDVNITTGAAKLTAPALSTASIELKLGAGDVRFESLYVSSTTEIKGGAGKITIACGTLNNLTLEMGVGELNFSGALLGNSDLKFGIGESNLTLFGGKDDYKVDIKKGIGSIFIDGNNVSDFYSSGNGQNHIYIEGGIGTVNIVFQED